MVTLTCQRWRRDRWCCYGDSVGELVDTIDGSLTAMLWSSDRSPCLSTSFLKCISCRSSIETSFAPSEVFSASCRAFERKNLSRAGLSVRPLRWWSAGGQRSAGIQPKAYRCQRAYVPSKRSPRADARRQRTKQGHADRGKQRTNSGPADMDYCAKPRAAPSRPTPQ